VTDQLDGRIGEAWGGEGANGCHLNVVLARRGSAAAAAVAGVLASPRPGHTPFLVCFGPGTVVHPLTVFVNRATIESEALGRLTWGAGQLGVGQGVLDAVADGLLDAAEASEIMVLVAVWIDAAAHDETALRRACREAMRAAIADALEPVSADAVRALAERRDDVANAFYTGD
jgi:5,6,7,8-tetrahydromethanopterin hydro-lyase